MPPRVAIGISAGLCAFFWSLQDQMCLTAVCHLPPSTPEETAVWGVKKWGGREWLPWLWRVSCEYEASKTSHKVGKWSGICLQSGSPKTLLAWEEFSKKSQYLGLPNSFLTKCFRDSNLETSSFLFTLLPYPFPSSTPQTLAPQVPRLMGLHESDSIKSSWHVIFPKGGKLHSHPADDVIGPLPSSEIWCSPDIWIFLETHEIWQPCFTPSESCCSDTALLGV